MIGKGIVLLFLAIGVIWDLKKKAVPANYLCVFGIVAIIGFILDVVNGKKLLDSVWGLIPGFIVVMLSTLTKEQVGLGDGVILLCVGCLQSVRDTTCMIFIALIMVTVVAMLLLIIRRVGRKATIPFVPFLFLGHLMMIIGGFL